MGQLDAGDASPGGATRPYSCGMKETVPMREVALGSEGRPAEADREEVAVRLEEVYGGRTSGPAAGVQGAQAPHKSALAGRR